MVTTLLVIVLCFCPMNNCLASGWKQLHEDADKASLSDALAAVYEKPGTPDDLYKLGLVYLNLHKDNEAKDIFNKMLSSEPDSIQAKWGLAEVSRRMHESETSEAMIKEILKVDPEFSPAYITLATMRYIQMKFDQAVRLAYKVREQGREKVDLSNYVRALLLIGGAKGMIAHYGGPLSKAINGTAVLPNLKKAEKLQPNSAGVAFGLGSFFFLAPRVVGGSLEKAEAYLKKTIELDPYFVDAYVRIAQLYRIKGDDARYQDYLKKAEEIDSKNEILLDFKSGKCKFICVGGGEG